MSGIIADRITRKLIKKAFPEVADFVDFRRYRDIQGYPMWAQIQFGLFSSLIDPQRQEKNVAAQSAYVVSLNACQQKAPVFWVEPEFLKAMAMTRFPESTDLGEFKCPYPSGLFVLPEGVIQSDEGNDIIMLGYSQVFEGLMEPTLPEFIPVEFADDGIAWCAFDAKGFVFGGLGKKQGTFAESFTDSKVFFNTFTGTELANEEAIKCTSGLCETVFKVMHVINARPSIIGPNKFLRFLKRKQKKKKRLPKLSLFEPRRLGMDYRIKSSMSENKGTGRPQRPHWRAGYTGIRWVGKGRQKAKSVWVEPYFVGSEEKEGENDEK